MINKHALRMAVKALRESQILNLDFDMGRVGAAYATYPHAECGTPMCVLGHYAARTDLQTDFMLSGGGTLWGEGHSLGGTLWGSYSREGYSLASLIRHHFGITTKQARELFDADGCGNASTAEEAAVYIEKFIAREGK